MKILNAICFQGVGGVDQVFRDYSRVLQKNGHDVALLISKKYPCDYLEKKIFKLRHISPIFDLFHIFLIALIFRPDVIFCHSQRIMKLAKFLRKLSNIKVIAINHGITFRQSLRCEYAISINDEINRAIIKEGFNEKKAFIVNNAIAVSEKYQEKEIKDTVIIGIYGRIEPRKGFDILLKAAANLKKEGVNFKIKIGGFDVDGSAYNLKTIRDIALNEGISDKCDFVGVVKNKNDFFQDVDILCVPSREEPFGLVILEGFLFSTLVISSNTDGGKLLIKDGENGLLFENGDPIDLARKIKNIVQNSDSYSNMTRKAFLRLEKDFSFDSLSNQIEAVITSVTKNNP